jgi:hypothetical protein
MVGAAAGGDAPARAQEELAGLAREHPRSQLVAFNEGWLAAYRQDAATAVASWDRATRLGPSTRLGRTAATLAQEVRRAAGRTGAP